MMANLYEDIHRAGFDTRPPMLDRSNFESWQQRIHLYCLGKDYGENILKSIDEGPFKMGKFRETLAEGALHLGLERDRVFADFTPEENERFKADIRVTNIILQDAPGRFTKLINDMWNIKMTMPKMQLNSKFVNNMLPEWGRFVTAVKLKRGLKQSNYDQLYAYLKQHEAHANENEMMLERYTQHVTDPLALVSNVLPHHKTMHSPKATTDSEYFKDKMLLMQAQENGVVLDEEQLLFIVADQCDAFDFYIDEVPTTHTMFMANLSSVDPIYDEAGPSYDSGILSKVQDHDNYVDSVGEYHEDNVVQVVQSNVSSVPNDALMIIINDIHEQSAKCASANE
uniref:Integrase, catalytic region, zinc finger, CCHC-type, peptidase aspartic, catalytic n=1 Tax=Tanacetum cinerariifolium TaxID=118510 RepID=A0A6L2L166_TANCI|nr:hypothetical protein [Tanacetum cinerariifolium]